MLVKFNNDSDVRFGSTCIQVKNGEKYHIVFLKDSELDLEYSEVKSFSDLPNDIKKLIRKIYGKEESSDNN